MKIRNKFTVIVISLFIFSAGFAGGRYYEKKSEVASDAKIVANSTLENSDFKLIFEAWREIKDKYIEDSKIDLGKMVYGSVKGFVSALDDPYTVFLDPDESEDFRENLNAELQGIGAEISVEDGNLIIVSPLRKSPAEKVGLRPRDIILEIDGKDAGEFTLIEAVMKIRGKAGTPVTLKILRKGELSPFDVTIVRDDIRVESVTYEVKEGNILYVSLNQFSDDTKKEFSNVVSEILLKKPKGIILDLRYNGGGYLDMAVEIISEFIDGKREAVRIKRRDSQSNEILYTSGAARISNIPLALLVNDGSASASEIVAGAIQDYYRGKIFGTQTFGKGSVQEIENLSDGSTLRITIAKWFTPHNRSIDDVGITPDRIMEITEDDFKNDRDPQMDAAMQYLKQF